DAVFSPDGRLIASAGWDNTVRIWDAASHRQVALLRGHTGQVHAVAFSPDGRLLASVAYDQTVRLWAVRSTPGRWETVAILPGALADQRGVAFSPDGKTVAAATAEGSIQLWDVGAWRAAGAPRRWSWSPALLRGHLAAIQT